MTFGLVTRVLVCKFWEYMYVKETITKTINTKGTFVSRLWLAVADLDCSHWRMHTKAAASTQKNCLSFKRDMLIMKLN